MPRCLPVFLCLLVPALSAAAPAENHDLAYSLGARLGERLREEVPDLQLEALLEGLRQAYRGQPLALDSARIEHLLNEHEQQLAAKPAQLDAASQRAMQVEKRFLANEKAKAGIRELPGGILRSELRAGNGAKPKASSKVQVRYVGRLADGSVFDQSEAAQWFRLDSVISGWRVALQEMPVGAKWRLVIPSAQAYGAEGAGDLIAPYAPLIFEVELLDSAE